MPITPINIPYIDNIDIPSELIKKCKETYTQYGKRKMYDKLNALIYNREPDISKRNLYIYHEAMKQSKECSENDGSVDYITTPPWKQSKWELKTANTTVLIKNQNTYKYNAEHTLGIDGYDVDAYYNDNQTSYGINGKEVFKRRGGKAIGRGERFDFEYRYSTSDYFRDSYKEYIFLTFQNTFINVLHNSLYNYLSKEDTESLYAVLGSLPLDLRTTIINKIASYVEYEKVLAEYNTDSGNLVQNITGFLSDIHETLLLPYKFITYLMCALVYPRYEGLIEDTNGALSTHVFGGINNIYSLTPSSIGPSTAGNDKDDNVSAFIKNIPIYSENEVTLYENYYIKADQEYNISCWSYSRNKWIDDIPLVDMGSLPLDIGIERKLIKIIGVTSTAGESLVYFIYSDIVITYNCSLDEWIGAVDEDTFHLYQYDIKALFSNVDYAVYSEYDKDKHTLIFLDNMGNIASHNLSNGYSTSCDGATFHPSLTTTIHLASPSNGILENIKKIFLIKGYSSIEDPLEYKTLYIVINNKKCQVLDYDSVNNITVMTELSFIDDTSIIVDVVCLSDSSKFYALFDDHKIVEYSMITKNAYTIQNKDEDHHILFGSKSFMNKNDYALYIRDDNTIHLIHDYINKRKRISTYPIPIDSYIPGETFIKKYEEVMIEESSILIFTHQYNPIENTYLYSKKDSISLDV
jgi:predicted secreted protein